VSKVEELVKLVAKKTGISEAMAKTAVNTVIGYLKKQLPAPIAAQIDGVLGGAGAAKGVEDLAKGLGGMVGKK